MADYFVAGTVGDMFSQFYAFMVTASAIVAVVAWWKLFQKAGLEGWKALIPFYNTYCLYKMAFGRDKGWMFIFMFVPCVGTIIDIIKSVKLSQNFGKGVGYAIGLIFLGPIFYLILGFGDAQYIGEPLD